MQYRVFDRQKLAYIDGGYVANYEIDDDYIVNNNSTISIVKPTTAEVGDVIALIETSGAFHKGIITAVDNSSLTISYKSDKELFNDNFINPLASAFALDTLLEVAGKFGISIVAEIIKQSWANSEDALKKLPLVVITEGDVLDESNEPKMLWTWDDTSINFVDWLVELFEKYNVVLQWTIDFDSAKTKLNERQPQFIVTLTAVTNKSNIIKDNVTMQTITYTEEELPSATVCKLVSSSTKEMVLLSSGKNLLNTQASTQDKKITELGIADSEDTDTSAYIAISKDSEYTFSLKNSDGVERYVAVYDVDRSAIARSKYNISGTGSFTISFKNYEEAKYVRISYYKKATEVQFEKGSTATKYDPYQIPAIYYLCNKDGVYSITLDSADENRIRPVKTVIAEYDIENAASNNITEKDAAESELIPSQYSQAIEVQINSDSKMFDFATARFGDVFTIVNKNGTFTSNYTGRKQTSDSKYVTLYFGLGRKNYTDLIQIRLRKQRYSVIYNRGFNNHG